MRESAEREPAPAGPTEPRRAENARRLAVLRLSQALTITLAACLIVVRFVAIDAASDSVSDTIRPWLIQGVAVVACAAVVVVALERLRVRGG